MAVVSIGLSFWLWPQNSEFDKRFCLLFALTFVVTFYALSYHYSVLLVLVFPHIIVWRKWVGGLLYALTFLPFLRLFVGVEQAYLDVIFVIALFVAVIVWFRTHTTLML